MDDLSPTGADQGDGVPSEGEPGPELGHELGDADLVAQVREGHDEPYAELYRRHQPAALALARTLTEHSGADDVVSEAFEKLLQRIRGGGGPEAAFRPYLLRTVRTVAVDASRRTRRLVVAEDPEEGRGHGTREDDGLVDAIHERTTLARAFAALPERWQTFLWLSFVDDADRAETARILGINVGSVSALGYRAREGLRRAYLDAHLRDAPTPECAEVWPLLAGAIRGGLGPSQQAEVDEHTAGCEHCRAALAELEAVNTRFGAVLAPIVLGAAAPAYLAAVQHGGAVASAAGAATSAAAAATAGGGADAGAQVIPGHASGLKGMVAGLGKTGVAVVACVSTVALVALLAVFTTPAGIRALGAAPAGHDRDRRGRRVPGPRLRRRGRRRRQPDGRDLRHRQHARRADVAHRVGRPDDVWHAHRLPDRRAHRYADRHPDQLLHRRPDHRPDHRPNHRPDHRPPRPARPPAPPPARPRAGRPSHPRRTPRRPCSARVRRPLAPPR